MQRTQRTVLTAVLLASAAACASAPPPPAEPVTSAESLLRAMHARYAGRWYRTLQFTQQTTRVIPGDSTVVETWREWASFPGRLRIEIGPREDGRGVLFANDSMYVVREGRVADRLHERNPLLILGFDVYFQPPERTLEQLRAEHFDLEPFRADSLEGRPMYVFGAISRERNSREVWVDAERLVFVRMIESTPAQNSRVAETWFKGYERLAGGWIAPEVEVLVDGRRVFHELYSDVRANVRVDSTYFDPDRWSEVR
ncbi:MAG TPA: hypothetical protein VFX98_10770 [Longimicrobiaceae bacterium]|nr:hypothetical protein [Longimicrobiaceae bacterium]